MSWSDRRARVAAEEARLAEEARAAKAREARAEIDALDDAEALERLGLPDPDALGPGDDFAAFMNKLVPGRIRARALRRLWGTNPVLANLDALVEYGEDYTDAATVVENLTTAYQVGKGMLAHVERLAREAREAEETGPGEDGEAEGQTAEEEGEELPATAPEPHPAPPARTALAEPAAVPPADAAAGEAEAPARRPRRMSFTVEAA